MESILRSLEEILAHFRTSKKNYIILYGPTASGKSDLAVRLAKELNGEVVNSDARQIYAGMAIGTGVVTEEEMSEVPHYLLQDHDPATQYDAMQFRDEAMNIAREISGRGHVPIFVGGTGLYIEALLGALSVNLPADPLVREELENECQEKGLSVMFEKLRSVDPVSAARIDPMNKRYVLRALEIWTLTGKRKSDFETSINPEQDFALYGLVWEREKLISRINKRHATMFADGFFEEVKALKEKNVLPEVWKTIGYPEASRALEGLTTVEEAVSQTQAAARQYAKRQMTWLRRMSRRYPTTLIDGEAITRNVFE